MGQHAWILQSHFGSLVDTAKNITLKLLRSTYISQLVEKLGQEKAITITNHQSVQTVEDHYSDQREVKDARGLSVFGGW